MSELNNENDKVIVTFQASKQLSAEALRVARLQNKTRSEWLREILEREIKKVEENIKGDR